MKTLNEKLNSCGKDYKKTDTALIILVERKMPSCFDMFIQTRNRALELSQSTTKKTFDDFCKGLINEQEWLIVSGQLTPNKALTALNKNHKKSFNNAKVLILLIIIMGMFLMLLMEIVNRIKCMILVNIVVKLTILKRIVLKQNV